MSSLPSLWLMGLGLRSRFARLGCSVATAVTGLALLLASGVACADPPSRVARLGYTSGEISFSPAGEDDWVQARLNRPLSVGDRLWAETDGRAEIQVGAAMIRISAGTGLSVLNLDDRVVQLQLTQGVLNLRVHRLGPGEVVEIDTPNLAFNVREAGDYRLEVYPDDDATTVVVRQGLAEVFGEGAAYTLDASLAWRFHGTGLGDVQSLALPPDDAFDRWSTERDHRYERSASARYVSPDMVGYQDLDGHGSWRVDASFGPVWMPSQVAVGWAPYRDGHWAWIDPWGWTWIDDAPWGFAVSHYGRWTNIRGQWGWVPGPVSTHAYYAPALVVFVGGPSLQFTLSGGGVSGVAWFPLGPREVYRPSYPVSREYFSHINRSNTVINNTVINNYYDHPTTVVNVEHRNRRVPGAVIAVPKTVFVQAQPVARAVQQMPQDRIAREPVAHAPALAPTGLSVRGGAAARAKPAAHAAFDKPTLARIPPAAPKVGYEAQKSLLEKKPGKPIDETDRSELRRTKALPPPAVKVIAAPKEPPKVLRPTAATSAPRPAKSGDNDRKAAPAVPAPAAAPPLPAARPGKAQGERDEAKAAPPTAAPIAAPKVVAPRPDKAQRNDDDRKAAPRTTATPDEPKAAAPPPGKAQRNDDDRKATPVPTAPAAAPKLPASRPGKAQGGDDRKAAPPAAVPTAAPKVPAPRPDNAQGGRDKRKATTPVPASRAAPSAAPARAARPAAKPASASGPDEPEGKVKSKDKDPRGKSQGRDDTGARN